MTATTETMEAARKAHTEALMRAAITGAAYYDALRSHARTLDEHARAYITNDMFILSAEVDALFDWAGCPRSDRPAPWGGR